MFPNCWHCHSWFEIGFKLLNALKRLQRTSNLKNILLFVTDGNGHLDVEISSLHSQIADVARLQDALLVAMGLGIGDPDGGLGVVGLLLVGPLHVQAGEQELGGVGVDRALDKLDVARHDRIVAEVAGELPGKGRGF